MLKKYRDKIQGSLTIRIFLITICILIAACSVTYLFIAWATPLSYQSIATQELQDRAANLVGDLEQTRFEDSGMLIQYFELSTGAIVTVYDKQGEEVTLPNTVDVQAGTASESTVDVAVQSEGKDSVQVSEDTAIKGTVTYEAAPYHKVITMQDTASSDVVITKAEMEPLQYAFSFQDKQQYTMDIAVNMTAVNQAAQAMKQVLPWLLFVVFCMAIFAAFFYSRYITKPIVKLSEISQKMFDLDFTWICQDKRGDEIGILGRNLNRLSKRLYTALTELQTANKMLKSDIDRERQLEQQRTAFFSAASHELKTPITILKGQLSGMLAGVDIYQDRDTYLARALAVTGRMESLVQEILMVSRMENTAFVLKQQHIDLTALIDQQAEVFQDLAEQQCQTFEVKAERGLFVQGDPMLFKLVITNLLTNAFFYSPEEAVIQLSLEKAEGKAMLRVTNSHTQIPEASLPHVFEAFYRVESSRNRQTGGSGLGLYLVKMILDRHHVSYRMENIEEGVQVTMYIDTEGINNESKGDEKV